MAGFELDHLSIFTTAGAPEAAGLEAFGLRRRGGVTRHGDFGTASTSFFFENTYLELFWSDDAALTARSVRAAGLDVEARMQWRATGLAPFGVMLRPTDEAAPLPFAATALRAGWMPGEVLLRFASGGPAEPYYAVIPRPLWYPSFRHNLPPVEHPLGVRTLTRAEITVTNPALSDLAALVNTVAPLRLVPGEAPLMTLTFDAGAQGGVLDARPALPLVIRY